MMDMPSRNQYLQTIRKEYLGATKNQKQKLLDEVQKRTKLNRKYLIRKLSPVMDYDIHVRKKRTEVYDGLVKEALVKVWEIFDFPCGQRLAPVLKTELDRLKNLGELACSNDTIKKLKRISSASIDRKLDHERQVRQLSRHRQPRIHPLLYQKIPMKTSAEWDRDKVGNFQLDYVVHCGSTSSGNFTCTLSATDIATGWWEGEAIAGRSQQVTHEGLKNIQKRLPFKIAEIHPDNDSGMINDLIYRYCKKEGIKFSRSRPNKKNDNAWVEQKNWTHIRKLVGYLRYDTYLERKVMNELYKGMSLYKNFCQPVMKLIFKERIGGKIKRKYDLAKTPYQRLLKLGKISRQEKDSLKKIYQSINPAELKRNMEKKRNLLYQIYQKKMAAVEIKPMKKQTPRSVTFYMIEPTLVRLPT